MRARLSTHETANYIFLQDEAALAARLFVDKTITDSGASLCYYAQLERSIFDIYDIARPLANSYATL